MEKLFEELTYKDQAERVTIVLESDQPPPAEVVKKVAEKSGVEPSKVAFVYAPTQSMPAARRLSAACFEVALHKAHEAHFPLEHIVDGFATAPLPPPHSGFRAGDGPAPMTPSSMPAARISS